MVQPPQQPPYPPSGSYPPPPSGSYPPPSPGSYPPPPSGPGAPAPRRGFADRLGARLARRPEPRLGVTLAGVGVALVIVGVVVWSGDYLAHGIRFSESGQSSDGGSRKLLGIALSLLVVATGYGLAIVRRTGPLATAGVVSSALGVPVLFAFLTFDLSASSGSGLPFSFDAVVLVSIVVWVLSYLLVPGARGHAFYLGTAAIFLWIYVVKKAEPDVFSARAVFAPVLNAFGVSGGSPDWNTVAVISFLFGLGYYAAMTWLDRTGRSGAGIAFAAAAFPAVVAGIAAAAPNLEQTGTGILLVVLGLLLAWLGAGSRRRFTTWVWGYAAGVGVVVLVGKASPSNATAAGIALIVCGVVVVGLGWFAASALREPPDEVPTTEPEIGRAPLH